MSREVKCPSCGIEVLITITISRRLGCRCGCSSTGSGSLSSLRFCVFKRGQNAYETAVDRINYSQLTNSIK